MGISSPKLTASTVLLLLVGLGLFKGLLWLGEQQTSLRFALLIYTALLPGMLLLAAYIHGRFNGLGWKQCGFGAVNALSFPLGLLVGLATTLGLIAIFTAALTPAIDGEFLTRLAETKTLTYLIAVVSSTEEFLFRGMVFLWLLHHSKNLMFSILASAMLFAITHLIVEGNPSIWFIALFSLGVIYGIVYERFGNCWLVAGLHTGFNLSTELHRRVFNGVTQSDSITSLQSDLAITLFVIALGLLWWTARQGQPGKLSRQIHPSNESV